jgi:hypothetical protein
MAYDFNDIFDAETPDGKDETRAKIDRTSSLAKKCLNSEDFQEYKKALEVARDSMIGQMCTFTHSFFLQEHADMAFYGAKMARMVTKLQDLTSLLGSVERDAKREILNEKT